MSDGLSWQFAENAHNRLILAGTISEESDFTPIVSRVAGPSLTVDLSGIQRINSCGVREWIQFAGQVNEAGTTLILERCPPVVVTQLSLISNFAGRNGRILSVLAPYYCESCDAEQVSPVDFSAGPVEIAQYLQCPDCQGQMEFDDVIEVYQQSYLGPVDQ